MELINNKEVTKKILVAFNPEEHKQSAADFLIPIIEGENIILFGTKSKRIVSYGMVVFIGREISVNNVFTRLVESGHKIPAVEEALKIIACYFRQINDFKIGQIVQISRTTLPLNFSLELAPVKKLVKRRLIP